ncbi:condensation domain-containing protein, partial [Streptomyces sp. CC216B]|uniref:condensation domain-containing protein n=1 Tax=Streptomyces sp. CC216B TaxID=3044570 RepID=UPI0024A8325D
MPECGRVFRVGEYLEIHGALDPVLFERALRQVVTEAEALHVRFAEEGGEVEQTLTDPSDWPLDVIDFGTGADPEDEARAWLDAAVARPMDITGDRLFEYALLRLGDDRFFWYQGYHHIVMDAFGAMLITRRVAEVYTSLSEGGQAGPSPFGALDDLVRSDRTYRASEAFARDRAYWTAHLADRPEPTGIVERPTTVPGHYLRRTARLGPAELAELRETGRRVRAPWSHLVIAATAIHLHRTTGASCVVVGLPVTARLDQRLRRTPGMASNVLPLRLSLRPDLTLGELLRQIAERVIELGRHQRYRAEDLQRDLGLPGNLGTWYAPVINIMSFDYALEFAGLPTTAHNLSSGLVGDFTIAVWDRRDGTGLTVDLNAHPEICPDEGLAAQHRRLLSTVRAVARSDAGRSVGRIDLLTDEERTTHLNHATTHTTPDTTNSTSTLPELFEAQAARTPHAPAITHNNTTLTYAQLNTQANQLAHHLITTHHIGPQDTIAIALPRTPDLITAILATLKTGAAYLPLDPQHPTHRLTHTLTTAQPTLTLTTTDTHLPHHTTTLHNYHPTTHHHLNHQPTHNPNNHHRITPLAPHHPAYLIHTSGSTGHPKGVV